MDFCNNCYSLHTFGYDTKEKRHALLCNNCGQSEEIPDRSIVFKKEIETKVVCNSSILKIDPLHKHIRKKCTNSSCPSKGQNVKIICGIQVQYKDFPFGQIDKTVLMNGIENSQVKINICSVCEELQN